MSGKIADIPSLSAGFLTRLHQDPENTVLLRPAAEGYVPVKARDVYARVRDLARGLMAHGVRPGDRVALMAANSPEWAEADFAILAAGAVTVPIYPSYGLKETLFALEDSGACILLLDGQMQLKQLSPLTQLGLPANRIFVRDDAAARQAGVGAWSDVRQQAGQTGLDAFEARLSAVRREDLATIVYTSGTSGWPRGVMLSHGNILSNIESWSRRVPFSSADRVLSFLPLSHVFERTTGHFGCYLMGVQVAYAERSDTVIRDLPRAKPTILIAVPRLFQVVYTRLRRDVEGRTGWIGALLRTGLGLNGESGATPVRHAWAHALAHTLLRLQFRRRMGGRLRFFVSGGAPLPREIGQFFLDLGVPILEGYGMTEASPVLAANPLDHICPGSVGPVLDNVDLRFGEDGEIQVRGPSVMTGYWNNEAATREALVDGWLRTGDVGCLNALGYLVITDRKKDLIVNSGGENIAPQKIEMRLLTDPFIDQAVVFGDRRPYLVALIHPNAERVREKLGPDPRPEAVFALLRQAVQRVLKDLPPYEQVRKFHVLEKPLSQEAGELTPTLKVKRRILAERFQPVLEALYQDGET